MHRKARLRLREERTLGLRGERELGLRREGTRGNRGLTVRQSLAVGRRRIEHLAQSAGDVCDARAAVAAAHPDRGVRTRTWRGHRDICASLGALEVIAKNTSVF